MINLDVNDLVIPQEIALNHNFKIINKSLILQDSHFKVYFEIIRKSITTPKIKSLIN